MSKINKIDVCKSEKSALTLAPSLQPPVPNLSDDRKTGYIWIYAIALSDKMKYAQQHITLLWWF